MSRVCELVVNIAPLSTVLMFNVQCVHSLYFIIHAPPSAKNIQLDTVRKLTIQT